MPPHSRISSHELESRKALQSRRELWPSIVVYLLVAFTAGCGEQARIYAPTLSFPPPPAELGSFVLEWVGSSWADAAVRVRRNGQGRSLWETAPGRAFVTAARSTANVREHRSMFVMNERRHEQCTDQLVDGVTVQSPRLELVGRLRCPSGVVPYRLTFEPRDQAALHFQLEVHDPRFNRVSLQFLSDPEERIFGLGEQFTWFDLKGRRVPIVVSEQGIGRGSQPVTAILDLVAGAGGNAHTTYAPIPHYITSRLRSFALDNSECSTFDFREPDRVRVEVWSSDLRGHVYAGDTPLDLIAAHTRSSGRMRPLPEWVHRGAIVGMQGGTQRVRFVLQQLRELGTPVAAFWLQDWVGRRTTAFGQQLWWNWELDQDHYPQWHELVEELRQAGIRVLTYVNPFLVDVAEKPNHRRNLFREARERGFLVRTNDGAPYMIQNTTFSAGLLDLTRVEAREWFLQILRENVIAIGASGWMADFGEGLPFDAVVAQGDAAALHNRYPELWAELNRAALERNGLGGEGVFFLRSAFTRSPSFATLFWLGDQMVTWDRHDGIKSAVVGLLSGGLSGLALNHSDIGGYTAIDRPLLRYHRSRELLLRWMELAAFQVVFRTHEGNLPEVNHQFYSTTETLRWFAYFARLFASWHPYREQLVTEAAETGAPVIRHLFLHYPEDSRTWAIAYEEFLVGRDLLFAPVLDPGQSEIQVYLPAGSWVHLWTGAGFSGPGEVRVAAPIGQPAVFFRDGSFAGELLANFARSNPPPPAN
ncbi:MAG: alpha-glucosidase [Candidatus Binatia bacterium]|nr:MAG: alpha-glucosidase [Candidatus Binatia bacterium]